MNRNRVVESKCTECVVVAIRHRILLTENRFLVQVNDDLIAVTKFEDLLLSRHRRDMRPGKYDLGAFDVANSHFLAGGHRKHRWTGPISVYKHESRILRIYFLPLRDGRRVVISINISSIKCGRQFPIREQASPAKWRKIGQRVPGWKNGVA